jgi:hypothetical protein
LWKQWDELDLAKVEISNKDEREILEQAFSKFEWQQNNKEKDNQKEEFVEDTKKVPEFDEIREIWTSKDNTKADKIENDLFLMIWRNYVRIW